MAILESRLTRLYTTAYYGSLFIFVGSKGFFLTEYLYFGKYGGDRPIYILMTLGRLQQLFCAILNPLLLWAAVTSCYNPPEPKLPAASRDGRGTFGCIINKKANAILSASATVIDNRYLRISAGPSGGLFPEGDLSFLFEIMDDPLTTKTYHLNDSSLISELNDYLRCYQSDDCQAIIDDYYNGKGYLKVSNFDNNCTFFTDLPHSQGFLTVTKFDTTNKIVSGTFEFTASANGSWCGTVEGTSGRFDLPYFNWPKFE